MKRVWIGAAAVVVCAAATPVVAQQLAHPVALNETAGTSERIAVLEQKVADLSARVASLQQQLTTANKAAFDANFKAGAATLWINQYGDNLVNTAKLVGPMSNELSTLNGSLNTLSQQFANHRHKYTYHYQHSDGYIVDINSATDVPCEMGKDPKCAPWTTH